MHSLPTINKITTGLLLAGAQLAVIPAALALAEPQHKSMETLVVTATRLPSALLDLSGNTGVVDSAALRLNAHTHIQESLLRVAGANFARGNGQEYLPALRSPVLTGAGACGGLLTAADGIALRAAGFCNINELFEANTEQAERIEVLRGPGGALYGSNAVHGVINVLSGSMDEPAGLRIGVEAGPHDYSRSKLTALAQQGAHSWRADLNAAHDGGYRADSGFDQQKLTLKHRFSGDALTITTALDATNLNQETAGYIVGEKAYKDDALKDDNPNPEAYRDASSARLYSRIDWQLDGEQRLVLTPYLRYSEMDFLQHFLPGTPLEMNGQQSVGLQSAYYRNLGAQWQLISGIDLEYTDSYLKERQDQPTQGSLFLRTTIPAGMHYDYDVEALMAAPFIQTRYQYSEALSVTLGLRYESMRYDYDNRMLDGRSDDQGNACGMGGCRYTRPADSTDSFNNHALKLGAVYAIDDQRSAYINLAQAFRAPQATELYRLQRAQLVADLESEEMDSVELGLRGSASRLSYDVAVYFMEKDQVIFRDADFFNISDGQTRHRGIEFNGRYQFSAQWDLAVAASYARHQYASQQNLSGVNIKGNDIDSAPRHFGSAQLGWNANADARVELEWAHQSREYTDPENLHRYEGHDLLNLRARWALNPQWQLTAKVTNLADRDYAERADYTGFGGDRYFPGEPRSYYLGVETHW